MILVAQIGARRHYAVPAALERAGLLEALVTDVCASDPWVRRLGRVIPSSVKNGKLRSLFDRQPTGVPNSKVHCLWPTTIGSQLTRKLRGHSPQGQYARWVIQNSEFGRAVVQHGFGQATAVYGFNAASVEIFEAAKAQGLKCILDMTIAPLEVIERLLTEERHRFPCLEAGASIPDSPDVLISREHREWELADLILCGSEYVSDSLAEVGVPVTKCRVVRWGYSGPSVDTDRSQRTGPLRVLIAGTVELRKGVPYALQAANLLPPGQFHFRFIGPSRMVGRYFEEQFLDDLYFKKMSVELPGPVPRSQMTLEYQNADVLLHPSLAEGSANVCYEAMAHGLPVIATPNAGAAITDGIEGLLIPIRDPEAIANALQTLRDDPAKRLAMGQAARERASRLTLHEYEQDLTHAVGWAHLPVRAEL